MIMSFTNRPKDGRKSNYWIMKSEPSEFGIDDFNNSNNFSTLWTGVRNYQARNFIKNDMQINDRAFFWHSSCKNPGIYGIIKISSKASPDPSQFDKTSKYFDEKSNKNNPRWFCISVQLLKKSNYISIEALRKIEQLKNLQVLRKGNRLSITKVTKEEWEVINSLINQ